MILIEEHLGLSIWIRDSIRVSRILIFRMNLKKQQSDQVEIREDTNLKSGEIVIWRKGEPDRWQG